MTDNNTETNNQDPRDLTHEEVLRQLVLARRAIKKHEKQMEEKDAAIEEAENSASKESEEKVSWRNLTDDLDQKLREEQKERKQVEKRLAAIMRAMKPIIAPEIKELEDQVEKAEEKLQRFENKVKDLVAINNG